MDSDIAGSLILQIVLIAVNAIFACAEIAVVSINDAKLEKMANEGNKKAVRLMNLTSSPSKFLATIQVAITLSGFLGSAFAADNFSDPLVAWLLKLGVPIPEKTLDAIAVILITLILSYVTLVFGELVPKRVAMKQAEKIALGISGLVSGVAKIFAPLVWLLTASTNGILRLFGIDPNEEEDEVTEEEIRMMVDAGSEKGTIDCEEKDMIQNVFEFDDIIVDEICTHRTDVDLLWMDDGVEEWEEMIHESRHSYYPVCGESVDDVVGILDAKDYFRLRNKTHENVISEAIKPAYFVPENIKAATLFRNMKKSGNYFAVVLDEYGGMDGIVTVRDLIEQLVGDLADETDLDKPREIEQINADTWKIMGTTSLDDVAEELAISLPVEEYETFGGYIFGELGAVPDDGSQFELETEALRIKVILVKEHRVENTIVKKLPQKEAAESKESAEPKGWRERKEKEKD
ncbi:MAG: hemolysin family protein [Fusicatenibacter sp.]